ncbi:acyl-CoA dehydrogenase family protein [Humibacter soli]
MPATHDLPPTDDALFAKYRPVFAQVADGAAEREQRRELPFEQIELLKRAGFTAVRVPIAHGGDGASLEQLFALLVELAAADPHIVQAFRGHIAFVEDRLNAPQSAERDAWLVRFSRGEMVGNAVTEIGNVALGDTRTRLTPAPDGWSITGSKYYTTGSIFAEWIDATALTPDGVEVAALVPTVGDSVTVTDDWTGFGQRLTGSGTAVFDAAPVRAEHVYAFGERFHYQTALYQLTLVAVLAGIARASLDDAASLLRTRARAFSHGNTPRSSDDPQLLENIGRLSANAFAADAATRLGAQALQRAYEAGSDEERASTKRAAELASANAQVVVSKLALQNATDLFEGLGASAAGTGLGLDRHWRNARTVAQHNPTAFKARIVGDALVNGAEPPYEWAVGVAAAKPAATTTTAAPAG